MGELLTFGSGLLAGAGASFCAACFLFLYLRRSSRKKMEKTYQQLLTRLDRAMGGQIQETAYDESMDAAVTERLNRVVRISRMHQEKAERERDTIKSLISDISHQVRTPLSGIMLYAGLALVRLDDMAQAFFLFRSAPVGDCGLAVRHFASSLF